MIFLTTEEVLRIHGRLIALAEGRLSKRALAGWLREQQGP